MKVILLVLFILGIYAETESNTVTCSQHCATADHKQGNGECYEDGTCKYGCSTSDDAYDITDKSCTHCKTSTQTEMYIQDSEGICHKMNNIYSRADHFIPVKDDTKYNGLYGTLTAEEGMKTETEPEILNEESYVGSGPCPSSQQYRIGKYYELNFNGNPADNIVIEITAESEKHTDIYLDLARTFDDENREGKCLGRTILRDGTKSNKFIYPYDEIISKYYLYVSIDGISEVKYNLKLTLEDFDMNQFKKNNLKIDQAEIEKILATETLSKTYQLEFSSKAPYMKSTCVDSMLVKGLGVDVTFTEGDYLLRFDTLESSRINMVELTDQNRETCLQFYDGKLSTIQNIAEEDRKYGVSFTVENIVNNTEFNDKIQDGETKMYMFMTEEVEVDITLTVSIICKHYCYEDVNNKQTSPGHCDAANRKCICNTALGFGGSDCHKMCFFNNTWQVEDNTNLCKFGSEHCDEWCGCEEGYKLDPETHECITEACFNGNMNAEEGDECTKGSRGCTSKCRCDKDSDWNPNGGFCKHTLCGNRVIDAYYKNTDGTGTMVKEECDGGFNCKLEMCLCEDGFNTDPDDPKSCKEPEFPVYGIVLICLAAVVVLVVLVIIFAVVIISIFRIKKVDLNEFKKQQSVYYYYIHGSSSVPPGKENKYSVEPTELEFGNDQQATNIHETRFERMTIRNFSKKKHMMIIFHTPNNPKFVFHFEPQVVFLRPRTNQSESTLYMTLHCTTKIREMKIPYTVWWSKSKDTLIEISEVLKDKSFEQWSAENKESMERLCKTVDRHIHFNLTIMTDAVTSTHIDMDEINLCEKPIAEGAMGKVYVGTYRSVTVAVKQFRWENLLPEEVEDLKAEVMAECDVMARLRNPFIANYMGSITYIPQISMVMQYFVMGSLGEYLRKEKEDYLKMSYKLKIRILFDTARGMQFLHENSIMHLDLKPDNLLVNSLFADAACCVKITDFGTSRLSKKTAKTGDKGLGTPIYLAPEGYKDEYTNGGDVFAFAVSAWELFYQEEPYKNFKSLFEIKNYVESGKRLEIDETMPPLLKNLIEECWVQQSSSRPSFEQICKKLNKVEEDAINHTDLDADVSEERVQQLMTDRAERLNKMMNDLVHE